MNSPAKDVRKTPKSERTRAEIMKAARIIISRDGLYKSRISDIVQLAGKSAGLFYTYFNNKVELFTSLVEEFDQHLNRSVPDPANYADNPGGLVRADVEAIWKCYRIHKADVKGLFETALTDEELRQGWQKLRKNGIRQFAYRIRKQQAIGLCQGMDPDLAGSALLGLLEFSFFNWEIGNLDYPGVEIDDSAAISTVVALLQSAMQLSSDEDEA